MCMCIYTKIYKHIYMCTYIYTPKTCKQKHICIYIYMCKYVCINRNIYYA